jgi:hypothetical protein
VAAIFPEQFQSLTKKSYFYKLFCAKPSQLFAVA